MLEVISIRDLLIRWHSYKDGPTATCPSPKDHKEAFIDILEAEHPGLTAAFLNNGTADHYGNQKLTRGDCTEIATMLIDRRAKLYAEPHIGCLRQFKLMADNMEFLANMIQSSGMRGINASGMVADMRAMAENARQFSEDYV